MRRPTGFQIQKLHNCNVIWKAKKMKIGRVMFIFVFLSGTPCLAEEKPVLQDEKSKINYSVGYRIGIDFKGDEVRINPDLLAKGIQDALSGLKPLMTADEQRAVLVNLHRKLKGHKEQNDVKAGQK